MKTRQQLIDELFILFDGYSMAHYTDEQLQQLINFLTKSKEAGNVVNFKDKIKGKLSG